MGIYWITGIKVIEFKFLPANETFEFGPPSQRMIDSFNRLQKHCIRKVNLEIAKLRFVQVSKYSYKMLLFLDSTIPLINESLKCKFQRLTDAYSDWTLRKCSIKMFWGLIVISYFQMLIKLIRQDYKLQPSFISFEMASSVIRFYPEIFLSKISWFHTFQLFLKLGISFDGGYSALFPNVSYLI